MMEIERVLKCLKSDCSGCERENYASCNVYEYAAEVIERLQSENTLLQAKLDKAVEDLQKLISRLRGKCNFCKNKDHFLKLEEPCISCNKVIKQNYEFEGLEESE